MSRRIRIALAVLLFAVAGATLVLWIRGYHSADRLHGRAGGRRSFLVASKEGRLVFVGFTSHGHPDWWQWAVYTYPADDVLAFPCGPTRQYEAAAGFGWLDRPIYFVMRPTYTEEDGTEIHIMGAATAMLQGGGPVVPCWFVFSAACVLGLALVRSNPPWRFSVRSLLVLITLTAVTLSLIRALDR